MKNVVNAGSFYQKREKITLANAADTHPDQAQASK
jgi:hypothetical protein